MSDKPVMHGRDHRPGGYDPIPATTATWCMAKATGTVPGDNTNTQYDLELAFGSGVDSGLYTQDTGGTYDTVQINGPGTYRIQWTAGWTGTILAPAEGQAIEAAAFTDTGVATFNFGFGGLPVTGKELLRATGDDYSDLFSTGGFLHWPTAPTTTNFVASHVAAHANENTGSDLTLILWVYIQLVDPYMLDPETAAIWNP